MSDRSGIKMLPIHVYDTAEEACKDVAESIAKTIATVNGQGMLGDKGLRCAPYA